jgi:hypothetical protein
MEKSEIVCKLTTSMIEKGYLFVADANNNNDFGKAVASLYKAILKNLDDQ